MSKLAPVVIFVYARPKHTINMIEALSKNLLAKDTDIYIFSDNYKKEKDKKNVGEVRKYINEISKYKYFKSVNIIEAENNKGLANSVIDGVNYVINKYGKVIVLEDDLITSKVFLEYMNNCLNFYENDSSIWSISGYNLPIDIPKEYKHDIYLSYRGCSWGWATWKDRWNSVDWDVLDYKKFKHNYFKRKHFNLGGPDMSQMLDSQIQGKCDSWAIRWCYEQSKQNKYTIYPIKSLIINQGLDGSGTHSGTTNDFDVKITEELPILEGKLKLNKEIARNFYNKYSSGIRQKIKEFCIIFRVEFLVSFFSKIKNSKFRSEKIQ